jgi:hypothetical protein
MAGRRHGQGADGCAHRGRTPRRFGVRRARRPPSGSDRRQRSRRSGSPVGSDSTAHRIRPARRDLPRGSRRSLAQGPRPRGTPLSAQHRRLGPGVPAAGDVDRHQRQSPLSHGVVRGSAGGGQPYVGGGGAAPPGHADRAGGGGQDRPRPRRRSPDVRPVSRRGLVRGGNEGG